MAASTDSSPKRLYLSGIPADRNSFSKLSEHFEKFGKISKIIVAYHGDPSTALVTFATHDEANAAMNSSEPVLGIPDILMRWGIRPEKEKSSSTPQASTSSSSSSPNTTSKIIFQCEKCTKVLSTKQTLRNHMRTVHAEFDCPECHEKFDSGNEFRKVSPT